MSSAQSVSNSILSVIEFRTNSFLEDMPKSKRKSKGQFFTSPETAEYMANMFSLNDLPADVCILDPGAGSGILSAAIIERLNKLGKAASITLDCFETDPSIINLLVDNLELIKAKSLIPMNYRVLEDDYILSIEKQRYLTNFSGGNYKKEIEHKKKYLFGRISIFLSVHRLQQIADRRKFYSCGFAHHQIISSK